MARDPDPALAKLAARRLTVAATLTVLMCAVYFGFLLLVAYQKPLLGRLVTGGLSYGIAGGVLVIVTAFVLTGVYVAWANRRYDVELARIARAHRDGGGEP
ncbi:MAG: DUF485 domain-containing protein [Myxococcales bacterium]|jgi:uncharacterized membrane protein (DUF485 family)|nr:DUF485 domain-containing protein [Myxococcales bacterium]